MPFLEEFTQLAVEKYEAKPAPVFFFTSLFKKQVYNRIGEINIETRRFNLGAAVDIRWGGKMNLNRREQSTAKRFNAPEYNEGMVATEQDLYTRAFGGNGWDESNFDNVLDMQVGDFNTLRMKIQMAIEKQCADAVTTGIVALENNVDIDFGRSTDSVISAVANGGTWADADSNIGESISKAIRFMKVKGMVDVGQMKLSLVLGDAAWRNMQANTKMNEAQNYKRDEDAKVYAPTKNDNGVTFHGFYTAGNYVVKVWTYDEDYVKLNLDGTEASRTPLVPDDLAIVIPDSPDFDLKFQAVGGLQRDANGNPLPAFTVNSGADGYAYSVSADGPSESIIHGVRARPVAVPVAVDSFATINTTA